jgi:hypothetical protein
MGKWVQSPAFLYRLGDVDLGNDVSDFTFLGYNTATNMWLEKIPVFSKLQEINITDPAENQVLRYVGSPTNKWQNSLPTS